MKLIRKLDLIQEEKDIAGSSGTIEEGIQMQLV